MINKVIFFVYGLKYKSNTSINIVRSILIKQPVNIFNLNIINTRTEVTVITGFSVIIFIYEHAFFFPLSNRGTCKCGFYSQTLRFIFWNIMFFYGDQNIRQISCKHPKCIFYFGVSETLLFQFVIVSLWECSSTPAAV